jgi:hypothetical protein
LTIPQYVGITMGGFHETYGASILGRAQRGTCQQGAHYQNQNSHISSLSTNSALSLLLMAVLFYAFSKRCGHQFVIRVNYQEMLPPVFPWGDS